MPSFAPGATAVHVNLVLWNFEADPPHKVAVIDDHSRLPRSDASWRGAD